MVNQYDSMTLANLRELAKEKGIKNITTFKKNELITFLMKTDSEAAQAAEKKPEAVPFIAAPEKEKTERRHRVADKVDQSNVINTPGAEAKTEIEKTERNFAAKNETVQNNAERRPAGEHTKPGRITHENAAEQVKTERKPEAGMAGEQIRFDKRTISEVPQEQMKQDLRAATDVTGEQSKQEIKIMEVSSEQVRNEQLPSAGKEERKNMTQNEMDQLDSGETKVGILEVLPDGYGFIRCDNYLPGENDVYVSPAQIRRFNLKTGDIVAGNTRIRSQNEKFSALLYIKSVNGFHPGEAQKRKRFEDLTPIFPNNRIHLETPGNCVAMRMVDLISPIGKGQRGMIVSQPKAGKTTLLKQIAKAVTRNHPDMKLIILLIDERPEEVTDIKESIEGKNVEVIYSTFDELPENHKRVSEMVIERAKRLVEHKQDVVILLDSITRLARAYNLTVQPSGRTLSGGLDPAALHMPKKFFGAARNMREGGSLTILATALVETGSRMDDVVFEEFKGTGNMELVLDRSLSEKRIFPAIDLQRSSTRRDDLLLSQPEMEATFLMRKALGGLKSDEALERIIDMFLRTKSNIEFIETIKKTKIVY